MARISMTVPALLAAAVLSGCYTLKFDLEGANPDSVQLTQARNTRTVKKFSESKMVVHLLFGLIPLGDADLRAVLDPHLAGGKRIANLKVHTLTWLDLGLVSLTGLTIEGDEIVSR